MRVWWAVWVVGLWGCAESSFVYAPARSTAQPEERGLEWVGRVGVRQAPSEAEGARSCVVAALEADARVSGVDRFYVEGDEGVDLVVELRLGARGVASWWNLPTCVPGLLILAPTWGGLRYDLRYEADVRAFDPVSGREVARVWRVDGYELRSAPWAVQLLLYGGAFVSTSVPVLTALYVTFDDLSEPWEVAPYDEEFAGSEEGRRYGERVVAALWAELAESSVNNSLLERRVPGGR